MYKRQGGQYGASGSYGGAYGGVDLSSASPAWILEHCCSGGFAEEDDDYEVGAEWALDPTPLAFYGNDQRPGQADSCNFWYSAWATPVVSSFTRQLTPDGILFIEGSGVGHDSMRVFLAPVSAQDGIVRWDNIYREDGDGPEPVMLPDLFDDPELIELVVYDNTMHSISATLPPSIEAGVYLPIVHSTEVGAAEFSDHIADADLTVTVLPAISSVAPSSLPEAGGYVTLSGAFFPSDPSKIVLEGYGALWHVESSTATSITAYATNLNQWGASFSISLEGVPDHPASCEADACKIDVETVPVVQAGDYRQLSAGADVSLTLTQMSDTAPDFWAALANDGAVWVQLDNGLKVLFHTQQQ